MKAHKFLIVIFLIISPVLVFSQALIKKGDKAFEGKKYKSALNYYKKAENKGDNSLEIKEKIANCYFFTGSKQKSYEYFQETEKEKLSAQGVMIYGILSQKMGKYSDAIELFEMAKSKNPSNPTIENLINSCKWALEHSTIPDNVETNIRDLELNGASLGVQFWDNKIVFSASPAVTPAGQREKTDMFYASYANDIIGRSFMLDNTFLYPLREGGVCFTDGGNTMYFSKEEPVGKGKYVFKIYTAKFNGSRWKDVKPIRFNSNKYSCAFPTISSNGKTIIFSSNMPGGKGGFDLWIASESNGDWGKAINLKQLNTSGNETYPFIDEENYLYFSSDGHSGYGGLDIFVSPNNGGRWDQSFNMMQPINSPLDDYSFVIDPNNKDKGFLISDKAANGEEVNLYSFVFDRKLLANNMKIETPNEEIGNKFSTTESRTDIITPNPMNEKDADDEAQKIKERRKVLLEKYGVKRESELTRDKRQDFNDELRNPEKYVAKQNRINESTTETSEYTSENGTETNTANNSNPKIIFKVQILSSRQPLTNLKTVAGYSPKRYFFKEMYRYTIGYFENVEDAIRLMNAAISEGYNDAFVAAFEQNTLKRLPDYVIYKD